MGVMMNGPAVFGKGCELGDGRWQLEDGGRGQRRLGEEETGRQGDLGKRRQGVRQTRRGDRHREERGGAQAA